VLFHHKDQIADAEHLLRRLYLNAKVGYLLRLKGKRSFLDIEDELVHYTAEDASIMEDPEVAENETLIALQTVMQKLPPAKRRVAELYFFQGSSVGMIARLLGLEEGAVKSIISETLKRLGEELMGKKKFSVVRA
jgi:RNA polymerase sigma factor (sigma-70 family)